MIGPTRCARCGGPLDAGGTLPGARCRCTTPETIEAGRAARAELRDEARRIATARALDRIARNA